MLRSLEQERAKYAWECIQSVEGDIDLEDKYKSYVRKTSSYIQVNGLGNTLAFYKSKFEADLRKKGEEKLSVEKKAYKLIYDHLNGWFNKQFRENKDILNWIISENTSSIKVFQATKEIIALLNWLEKFAEAELRDKETVG